VLPQLHGKPARVQRTQSEATYGQEWAYVGEQQIPVAASRIAVGRKGPANMVKTLTELAQNYLSPAATVGHMGSSQKTYTLSTAMRSPQKRQPPNTRWLRAVSFNIDPGFYPWVYYVGGPTGVLNDDVLAPRVVKVLDSKPGGATGMLVLVQMPPSGYAVAPNPDNRRASIRRLTPLVSADSPNVGMYGSLQAYRADVMRYARNPTASLAPTTSFTAPTSVCCYDAETGRLVCPGSARLNGRRVELLAVDNADTETPRARVRMPDGRVRAVKICPADGLQPGAGVPIDCCFDGITSKVVCSSSTDLNGQTAKVMTELDLPSGQRGVVVALADGQQITIPLCRPTTSSQPESCCVNERTMRLVCDDTSHPWHNVDVSLVAQCYDDPNTGARMCFVDISGDANTILPVCDYPSFTSEPKFPPPPIQSPCCFRKSTMTIECEDTSNPFHGIVVPSATVSFGVDANGEYADINLGGDEMQRMPVCDEPLYKTPPGGGSCPPGYSLDAAGNCTFTTPTCPPGQHVDPVTGICVPDYKTPPGGGECPPNYLLDPMTGQCYPSYTPPPPGEACPAGSYVDPLTGQCYPSYTPPPGNPCPTGYVLDMFGNCVPGCPTPPKSCCDSCAHGGICESACPGPK
jgi:hypothetical protein